MVFREAVQTLNLDRREHTRVSRLKSFGRGTVTRGKQEAGMRTKPRGQSRAAVRSPGAGQPTCCPEVFRTCSRLETEWLGRVGKECGGGTGDYS